MYTFHSNKKPTTPSMTNFNRIQQKIQTQEAISDTLAQWRAAGQRIVFTNGCFDLLHYGHLHYLAQARDLADRLVIGLNSAASVQRLKGPHRPINDELTRTHLLAALQMVDAVVVFEEDTPLELIRIVQPDILVKGGDWSPDKIVGSTEVKSWGGAVHSIPFIHERSTTETLKKIRGL
jgi:D-beta-D-heptose 7-phosphate kinase/D-beta-D-heptose 1-phosphate adenosyltransferase